MEDILEGSNRVFLKAGSGKEALSTLLKHDDIGLILMDVQMPELDGLETTRIIRRRDIRQPFIIAMTAGAMAEDKIECLEAGMNYFISKPISIQDLINVLEKSYIAKENNTLIN